MIDLHHSDALDLLAGLAAGSVGLMFLDGPYHGVKDLDWDKQWGSDSEFLAWMGRVLDLSKRALEPNGSIYVCASPRMSYGVEGVVRERFNVLNSVRWYKGDGTFSRADVTTYRSWLAGWEGIVFAEQWGADSSALGESGYSQACDELRGFVFEPLRAYLDGERTRAGYSDQEMRQHLGISLKGGGLLSHYWGRSQWSLPTRKHYEALRDLFNQDQPGKYLKREYESLRAEYEDLKREYESLRRPFNNTRALFRDDWHYPQVEASDTKHPTAKPVQMLLDIITTSSRPGDLICDPFLGGGTTAVAVAILNKREPDNPRRFVGCDLQQHWIAATQARLDEVAGKMRTPVKRGVAQSVPEGQLRMEL